MKSLALILFLSASTLALGPNLLGLGNGGPLGAPAGASNAPCDNNGVVISQNTSVIKTNNGDIIKKVTVKKSLGLKKHHHRHGKKHCGCKHGKKIVKKTSIVIKRKVHRKNRRGSKKITKAIIIKKSARKGRKFVVAKKTISSRRGRVAKSLTIKKSLRAGRKHIRANKTIIARKTISGKRGVVASKVVVKKSLAGKRGGRKSRKVSVYKTVVAKKNGKRWNKWSRKSSLKVKRGAKRFGRKYGKRYN